MNQLVPSVKSQNLFLKFLPQKSLVTPKALGTDGLVFTANTHMRGNQEDQLEPEQKNMFLVSEEEIQQTQWSNTTLKCTLMPSHFLVLKF